MSSSPQQSNSTPANIGDPFGDQLVVPREELEEVFYDYSPREIVQLLWTENLEGIHDAMQEKIWACAQCYTCAARCPFGNSPGGLVMVGLPAALAYLAGR